MPVRVGLENSRRIGERSGVRPWPRRRRIPAASIGVYTSAPWPDQRGGQEEISPQKRGHRSLTAAGAVTVQDRLAESVKAVVPAASAVKSGLATTVPPIPLRTSAAWMRITGVLAGVL